MTDLPSGGLACDEIRDLAAPFVLGALDDDAAAAVRDHLATCPESHPEFADLGSVAPVLAASVPVMEPPAALKDRIMAAAAAELEARSAPTSPEPSLLGVSSLTPITHADPVSVMPRRATGPSIATWTMRIAAVLAIALLGGWNLLLQGQLGSARVYEDSVAAVLRIAGQDGSLTAILTPPGDAGPSGLAAVSASGAVTLAMRDLPATSGPQVYEAWIIGSDGVPVPLGGFQVDAAGIASFSADGVPAQDGIVLALTLEPGPGATAPSSAPVSLGTATTSG